MIVKDTVDNEHSGEFVDWRLTLWGDSIDGSKQPLHPLPDTHDDDHPYEDAQVATTTVATAPLKTSAPTGKPDDHHDRPINEKPTQSAVTETATASEKVATATSKPELSEPSASSTSVAAADNYFSTYLPSFGASKRTQVWIYASLAMIIVFFIGLGIYFQLQRIKRRRTSPEDDYEFEIVEDDDDMHPMPGTTGRTQRRGGELYNAFAGESDEEVFSDDDNLYQDRLANISEKDGEDDSSPGDRLLSEKR